MSYHIHEDLLVFPERGDMSPAHRTSIKVAAAMSYLAYIRDVNLNNLATIEDANLRRTLLDMVQNGDLTEAHSLYAADDQEPIACLGYSPNLDTVFIAFPGTKCMADAWVDANVLLQVVRQTGWHVHTGFQQRASAFPIDLLSLYLRNGRTIVCGHSLGGAVAKLIGLTVLRTPAIVGNVQDAWTGLLPNSTPVTRGALPLDHTFFSIVTFGCPPPFYLESSVPNPTGRRIIHNVIDPHDPVPFLYNAVSRANLAQRLPENGSNIYRIAVRALRAVIREWVSDEPAGLAGNLILCRGAQLTWIDQESRRRLETLVRAAWRNPNDRLQAHQARHAIEHYLDQCVMAIPRNEQQVQRPHAFDPRSLIRPVRSIRAEVQGSLVVLSLTHDVQQASLIAIQFCCIADEEDTQFFSAPLVPSPGNARRLVAKIPTISEEADESTQASLVVPDHAVDVFGDPVSLSFLFSQGKGAVLEASLAHHRLMTHALLRQTAVTTARRPMTDPTLDDEVEDICDLIDAANSEAVPDVLRDRDGLRDAILRPALLFGISLHAEEDPLDMINDRAARKLRAIIGSTTEPRNDSQDTRLNTDCRKLWEKNDKPRISPGALDRISFRASLLNYVRALAALLPGVEDVEARSNVETALDEDKSSMFVSSIILHTHIHAAHRWMLKNTHGKIYASSWKPWAIGAVATVAGAALLPVAAPAAVAAAVAESTLLVGGGGLGSLLSFGGNWWSQHMSTTEFRLRQWGYRDFLHQALIMSGLRSIPGQPTGYSELRLGLQHAPLSEDVGRAALPEDFNTSIRRALTGRAHPATDKSSFFFEVWCPFVHQLGRMRIALVQKTPVLGVLGPGQSGKTSLLAAVRPNHAELFQARQDAARHFGARPIVTKLRTNDIVIDFPDLDDAGAEGDWTFNLFSFRMDDCLLVLPFDRELSDAALKMIDLLVHLAYTRLLRFKIILSQCDRSLNIEEDPEGVNFRARVEASREGLVEDLRQRHGSDRIQMAQNIMTLEEDATPRKSMVMRSVLINDIVQVAYLRSPAIGPEKEVILQRMVASGSLWDAARIREWLDATELDP